MSHALLILKIYTTFKDVQVMLKHFFDISTGFRNKKKWKRVLRPSIETSMSRYVDFWPKIHLILYIPLPWKLDNSHYHMSTANWLPMSLASLGPKFELFLKTAFIGCCDLTNSLGERLKSDQTMSRGYFNLSWPLNFIMNTLSIDFNLKLVKKKWVAKSR